MLIRVRYTSRLHLLRTYYVELGKHNPVITLIRITSNLKISLSNNDALKSICDGIYRQKQYTQIIFVTAFPAAICL